MAARGLCTRAVAGMLGLLCIAAAEPTSIPCGAAFVRADERYMGAHLGTDNYIDCEYVEHGDERWLRIDRKNRHWRSANRTALVLKLGGADQATCNAVPRVVSVTAKWAEQGCFHFAESSVAASASMVCEHDVVTIRVESEHFFVVLTATAAQFVPKVRRPLVAGR